MADISCDNITIAGVLAQTGSGDSYFTGRLGIGTSGPSGRLHVIGDDGPVTLPPTLSHADAVVSNDGHSLLHIVTPSSHVGGVVFDDPDGQARGYLRYSHAEDDMRLYTAGSPRLTIGSSGNVGIGTESPTERLEVDGNLKARGSITAMGPLDFTAFPSPGAPTAADSGQAGNVDVGTHSWVVTFTSAGNGETTAGTPSNVVSISGSAKQVNLTAIPIGPLGTTGRKIYRTVAGNTGPYKLVDTIPNNTATIYTDDRADAALGAEAPTTNTTAVVEIRAGGVPRLVTDKDGNLWVGSRIAIDSGGYPLYG